MVQRKGGGGWKRKVFVGHIVVNFCVKKYLCTFWRHFFDIFLGVGGGSNSNVTFVDVGHFSSRFS